MHYLHITNQTNAVQIARFTIENALVVIECDQNYVYAAWPVFLEIGKRKSRSRLLHCLPGPCRIMGNQQSGVR